jgi:hypothetical protein
VKDAAVTVPVVVGSVTPPVLVRPPAGVSTTVPPVVDCTATLPKFISTVLEMLIGVTIVAVAVAVAVSCACTHVAMPAIINVARKNLFFGFIVFCFQYVRNDYAFRKDECIRSG